MAELVKNSKGKEKEPVVYSEMGTAVLNEKHSTSRLISKRRHVSLPQWATAWIVLIPAMIFLVFFMFYPIINTFLMAFINNFSWRTGGSSFALGSFFTSIRDFGIDAYNRDGTLKAKETILSFGFDNFFKLFQGYPGQLFTSSIVNTFVLVIVEVPLTIIISLLLATFLHSIKALKGLFQTIFFLPYVTNAIALGMVFQMLFSTGQGGIINLVLKLVSFGNLGPINWLNHQHPTLAYNHWVAGIVIVVYSVWNGLAFKILVFMSGLATIDKQYSDAAKIDGASSFTIWRRITLPLLSPQILYITITSFIGAFKMYSGVMSVFSNYAPLGKNHFFGGNSEGTDWMPIVGWIYKAMDNQQFGGQGVAAAGSLVLLAIILVVTAIQGVVSKKRVHY